MIRRASLVLVLALGVWPLWCQASTSFTREAWHHRGQTPAPDDSETLEVARVLAARYPENASTSYIPALAWSSAIRLTALTGEPRWKDKAARQMQPFVSTDVAARPGTGGLPGIAGYFALFDLGHADAARRAADFVLAGEPEEPVRFARGWTDDMFMVTSLVARVASRFPDARYERAVGRLLTTYAERLQRADGLFIHAVDGPHAWGRGNGFAALGLVEALTHLPAAWSERPRVLEIYRRHMRALAGHQSDEGSWRQVVDEPDSYRELTVTAMVVAAMARGVRLGWLDSDARPSIDRGWRAVAARVAADGTVRDVCASTGAGATKEHYLNRPAINGADDRGGAVALLAALEVAELRRN